MFAYALIRNRMIAKDMMDVNQKLLLAGETDYKDGSLKVNLIPFISELAQSPVASEEYQL